MRWTKMSCGDIEVFANLGLFLGSHVELYLTRHSRPKANTSRGRPSTMGRTIESRRRHRIGIEPLEARELLSGGTPRVPIRGPEATPSAPLTLTARLAPRSDPDGNGVVLRSTVTIVGETVPGARVSLGQDLGR